MNDVKYSDKNRKLLSSTKYPLIYRTKIDMNLVNTAVINQWIHETLFDLLEFDDDVLVSYCQQLLHQHPLDPKQMQINLTGFLEDKTVAFMKLLFQTLISAQESKGGVPKCVLDKKKEQLRLQARKQEISSLIHDVNEKSVGKMKLIQNEKKTKVEEMNVSLDIIESSSRLKLKGNLLPFNESITVEEKRQRKETNHGFAVVVDDIEVTIVKEEQRNATKKGLTDANDDDHFESKTASRKETRKNMHPYSNTSTSRSSSPEKRNQKSTSDPRSISPSSSKRNHTRSSVRRSRSRSTSIEGRGRKRNRSKKTKTQSKRHSSRSRSRSSTGTLSSSCESNINSKYSRSRSYDRNRKRSLRESRRLDRGNYSIPASSSRYSKRRHSRSVSSSRYSKRRHSRSVSSSRYSKRRNSRSVLLKDDFSGSYSDFEESGTRLSSLSKTEMKKRKMDKETIVAENKSSQIKNECRMSYTESE